MRPQSDNFIEGPLVADLRLTQCLKLPGYWTIASYAIFPMTKIKATVERENEIMYSQYAIGLSLLRQVFQPRVRRITPVDSAIMMMRLIKTTTHPIKKNVVI
jgi:hypothetical protein